MIAVVDSGGANVASVLFALERLGVSAVFTADPDVISKASHVILPGVGAAQAAMRALEEKDLIACLCSLTQPVLGICLGMQLLFSHLKEGDVEGLGLLSGTVEKFDFDDLCVPHTGWNQVQQKKKTPFFEGIADESFFYFVHSFYAPQVPQTLGLTEYGCSFTSVVARDNFFGCQFHPERSGAVGAQLLKNFVGL